MKRSTTDSRGREVRAGDVVRVLSIPAGAVGALGPEERDDVLSMAGESFEVEDIDDYGHAWVSKWWDRGEHRKEAHSLGLAPSDMVLVDAGVGT